MKLTQRDQELVSGRCPPERPCGREDVAEFRRYHLKQRGLGDWIECLLSAIGITADLFPSCGCDRRRDWLNALFLRR